MATDLPYGGKVSLDDLLQCRTLPRDVGRRLQESAGSEGQVTVDAVVGLLVDERRHYSASCGAGGASGGICWVHLHGGQIGQSGWQRQWHHGEQVDWAASGGWIPCEGDGRFNVVRYVEP